MQAASVGDRRSSNGSLSIDEVISAVHQHALEICEQQLLSSRGRLSNEQVQIARTVIVAIVDRLLAVPAARIDAASERRDYAELLVRLFEPEPFLPA
jgi:glutamyl-tRNA reductase